MEAMESTETESFEQSQSGEAFASWPPTWTTDDIVSAIKDATPDDLSAYVEALVERGGVENLRMLIGASAGSAGRIPPQDIDAERSVLGAMLQHGAGVTEGVSEVLTRGDFYASAHAAIFDAMVGLSSMGKPVDAITTADELTRRSSLESMGGAAYLAELMACACAAESVKEHAAIVSEKAMRRTLIETTAHVSALAYDETSHVSDIAAKAENAIFAARDRDARSRRTFRDMPCMIRERIDTIFREHAAGPQAAMGAKTHFAELDRAVALKPGALIVIAGRPSMGKTSCAISIGANVACSGLKVAVFSQEMPCEDVTDEILSGESGIDGYKFDRPWLFTDDELEDLTDAGGRLWKTCLEIDDTEDLTPAEVAARCRRFRAKNGGLDLVIIDYLGLMRLGEKAAESRNVEIGEIAKRIKHMAKRLRVPVILLSQLSRAVERRDNKRPMLSDLYESGGIEAHADVVMFIYRPAYYEQKRSMEATDAMEPMATGKPSLPFTGPSARERGDYWDRTDNDTDDVDEAYVRKNAPDDYDRRHPEEVEIIVAKQKKGPTGVVKLGFFPHLRKFVSLETHRQENPY